MSIDAREEDYIERLREEVRRPRLLAQGDSWFSPACPRSLLRHVDWLGSYHILNVSVPGEELGAVLAGTQRARLRNLLCDDDIGFELILFSGGIGDLVGEGLLGLLTDLPPGGGWQDAIDEQRLARRLARIESQFHELMDLRDDYRPSVEVLVHGYDFPVPGGPPGRLGPAPIPGSWTVPYLLRRGIDRAGDQRSVVHHLVERLDAVLRAMAKARRGFVYVHTQGTLARGDWDHELHPSAAGFRRMAELYRPQLGRLFPMHTR